MKQATRECQRCGRDWVKPEDYKALEDAVVKALRELGEPTPAMPDRVANAIEILTGALNAHLNPMGC